MMRLYRQLWWLREDAGWGDYFMSGLLTMLGLAGIVLLIVIAFLLFTTVPFVGWVMLVIFVVPAIFATLVKVLQR
jgi:hypothetical protein